MPSRWGPGSDDPEPMRIGVESPFRKEAEAITKAAGARNYNLEYGFSPGDEGAYTQDNVTMDEVPMATDCVQFVLWLRSQGWDITRGPAGVYDPAALGDAAIEWTGE